MDKSEKVKVSKTTSVRSVVPKLVVFLFIISCGVLLPKTQAQNQSFTTYPPAEGFAWGMHLYTSGTELGEIICSLAGAPLDHVEYSSNGLGMMAWCVSSDPEKPPFKGSRPGQAWRAWCYNFSQPQVLSNGAKVCMRPGQPLAEKESGDPYCPVNKTGGTNPINITNGNKYQQVRDLQGSGDFPLRMERYYNSTASESSDDVLGNHWRHFYQRQLRGRTGSGTSTGPALSSPSRYTLHRGWYSPVPVPSVQNPNFPGTFFVERADGSSIYFQEVNGIWQANADPNVSLFQLPANEGWQFTDANDNKEFYSTTGKLTRLENAQGVFQILTYDTGGRLSQVQHQFGHTLSFSYDSNNRISSITTADAQVYQYQYDSAGRLVTVVYPGNDTETYHYEMPSNYPNHLTGISKNNQRYATWGYNTRNGYAISSEHAGGADKITLAGSATYMRATNALGATFVYQSQLINGVYKPTQSSFNAPLCGIGNKTSGYDTNGWLNQSIDFEGNKTTYVREAARGLELSRTEAAATPQARTINTEWHAEFRLPTKVTEPGRETVNVYDVKGNRLSQTIKDLASLETRTTTWTYNTYGQVLTINGPRTDVNDVTTYIYYDCSTGFQCGQLATVSNALGQVTSYNSYDAQGRVLTITDANGIATTLTYTPRGWLDTVTRDGATTDYDYNAAGQVIKITSATGSIMHFDYDAAERLVGMRDGLGNRIEYVLNALGNRTAENTYDPSNVLKKTSAAAFDEIGRLIQSIGASSQTTAFVYDKNGQQTQLTDANTQATNYAYDALSRLKEQTDAALAKTRFVYDARDNLIEVIDARGLVTSYNYNGFDEVITQISPDTGTTSYLYDKAGNLIQKTDAKNIVTHYSYDVLNRITAMQYPSDAALNVTYRYDGSGANAIGRLTGIDDALGSIDYAYDARGNVILQSHSLNPDPWVNTGNYSTSIAYSYDLDNRLSSITYPSGRVVSYTRDLAAQINQVSSTLGLNSQTILDQIQYQPFGGITDAVFGNGLNLNQSFDQDAQLTALSHKHPTNVAIQALNLGLTYDPVGNITGITNNQNTTKTQSFVYDNVNRLSNAQSHYGNISYAYDAVGNRNSKTDVANTGTLTDGYGAYVYATTANQLTAINKDTSSTNYSYDANGNPTSIANNTYIYNAQNRLSQVKNAANQNIANYAYNALGQRMLKTTGSTTTLYLYDQSGMLLSEVQANGSARDYIYINGQRLSIAESNNYYYIHSNHLDTPQSITDQNQAIVWAADYDPFGKTTVTINTIENNLRFPGQYFDQETGTHYNYFRDYDPMVGRYLQSDPIGLGGGVNTYGYVLSNPLKYFDMNGLKPCPPGTVPPGVNCWIDEGDGKGSGYPNEGRCATAECAAGLPPVIYPKRFPSIIPQTACEWTCYGATITCGMTDGPGFIADLACSFAGYKVCVASMCGDRGTQSCSDDWERAGPVYGP